MAFYAYSCPECGEIESTRRGDSLQCPTCGIFAKRIWTWTAPAMFIEHYNPTFGTVLRNRQHAKDHAMKVSDEQSERLGMTVNYELTDALDNDAAGIKPHELEAAREAVIKQGEKEAAQRRGGVKITVGNDEVQL